MALSLSSPIQFSFWAFAFLFLTTFFLTPNPFLPSALVSAILTSLFLEGFVLLMSYLTYLFPFVNSFSQSLPFRRVTSTLLNFIPLLRILSPPLRTPPPVFSSNLFLPQSYKGRVLALAPCLCFPLTPFSLPVSVPPSMQLRQSLTFFFNTILPQDHVLCVLSWNRVRSQFSTLPVSPPSFDLSSLFSKSFPPPTWVRCLIGGVTTTQAQIVHHILFIRTPPFPPRPPSTRTTKAVHCTFLTPPRDPSLFF